MKPRHGILLLALLLTGCRDPRPVQAIGGWRVVDSAGSLTRSEGFHLARESLDAIPVGGDPARTYRPRIEIDARPTGHVRLYVQAATLSPSGGAPRVRVSVDGRPPLAVAAIAHGPWVELPRATVELLRGGRIATFRLRARQDGTTRVLRYDLAGLEPSLAALQAEAAARDAAATPAGVLRGLF